MNTPWFTEEEVARLLANARRWYGTEEAGGEDDPPFDPEPVALLHLPGTPCRWLVFGIDAEGGDADDPILVVLADLGLGCIEYGTVFARELADGAFGRPAVRDPNLPRAGRDVALRRGVLARGTDGARPHGGRRRGERGLTGERSDGRGKARAAPRRAAARVRRAAGGAPAHLGRKRPPPRALAPAPRARPRAWHASERRCGMPEPRDGGWDPGRVETLRALWTAGVPTAAIAARIGATKNAVIGKAHRLGLPPRPAAIRPPAERAAVPRPAVQHLAPPRPAAAAAPVPSPAPGPPTTAGEPRALAPRGCGAGHACRWPFGDPREPGFRFCAAPALPGRSYCGPHFRRAYVLVAERVA